MTIDHVPMRAAFKGRLGPEGFEFPACLICNSTSSSSEQVFALYARLFDRNDNNYDQAHLAGLIAGVRNNHPELMPNPDLPASEKRRVLRHYGWAMSPGSFLEDLGMVAVPADSDRHIEVVARKLAAALFYRHLGSFVSEEHGVYWGWSQQGLPGVEEAQDILLAGMPDLVIGERVNTSICDQFAYRWGFNQQDAIFGFAAGFGAGIFLFGAVAPWETTAKLDHWQRFEPLSDEA